MKKTSERRKERRVKRLKAMIEENPKKFSDEWSKRLESWEKEAKSKTKLLGKKVDGQPVPGAFEVVERMYKILNDIGPKALELEGEKTNSVMRDIFKNIAQTYDGRMYRFKYPLNIDNLYVTKNKRE